MNAESPPLLVAVSVGDPGGIGPEVTLKAIAAELNRDNASYLVLGDPDLLQNLNAALGLKLVLTREGAARRDDRVRVRNPHAQALPPGLSPGSTTHAMAAMACLKDGAGLCLGGEASALVTAPLNKESIIRSGERDFVGQTEYLSALAKTNRTAMMLLGYDERGRWLRVALATTHVPISKIAQSLTREKIELAIELAAGACRDLDLPRARIGVCGLNPHAGEGGKIGQEEITVIRPAIEAT